MTYRCIAAALAFASVASLLAAPARPAGAAEPDDNDELVASPDFTGLPDKDSHSGVFLDLVGRGSSSIAQDAYFRIVVPSGKDALRVAVFDGNCAGWWDQNRAVNDAYGAPVPDGSVVEYTLLTDGPGGVPARRVVALADAENATPRPGAVVFSNAVDARWELLVDAPHHPAAALPGGEHRYVLVVRYRLPLPPTAVAPVNGYKLAACGFIGQAAAAPDETLLGGFVGGVVDSRNLVFTADDGGPPALCDTSVSRDPYPDLLEPPASLNARFADEPAKAPAVRYPSPDPFVNAYAGDLTVRVRLVPPAGQAWGPYLDTLVLEEGDADDADDATGLAPDGTPSPSDPGVPPDDGRKYVDAHGHGHDSSGYRLPVAALPSDAGSPWLELVDPRGEVRVTLFDLSGNVADEDATGAGFERIPVPRDGVPGDWTIRVHHLDARNSWFLRTNAEIPPVTQSLSGRVYRDLDCDGDDEGDTEPALAGLTVRVEATSGPGAPVLRVTDADGAWTVDPILPGTYAVSVVSDVPNMTSAVVQPLVRTVAPGLGVRDVDVGYCETPCGCGETGRLHSVCLEASVWLPDPTTASFDVYVRLDEGCGCDPPLVDLACFGYDGAFPGERTGRNGLVVVKDLRVVDGYAKVLVCVTADPAWFPGGFFDGDMKLTVVVNGVGEAACGRFSCACLEVGGTFPCDWRPRWCDDVPDFVVKSYVPWECWPDRPCTDGCVRDLAWWRAVNRCGACPATRIPWPVAGGEDRLLCGRSWLRILQANARRDAWVALAQQWIVATLNAASGACAPAAVAAAVEESATLLAQGCGGRCDVAEGRARRLLRILAAYNDGEAGPVACPGKAPRCPPPPCDPRPKGNNGVGNGLDPPPPGNPPVNDGPGTSPGKPGNRGGASR